MEDNIIMTDLDESIGFYKDLYKMFSKVIEDAIKGGDIDTAEEQLEYLKEINEYKEYTGLLLLSMNNGMGFTCEKLATSRRLKDWEGGNM